MNSSPSDPIRPVRRRNPITIPYRQENWDPTQDLTARFSAIWNGSPNPARPSPPPRWHYGGPDAPTTYE